MIQHESELVQPSVQEGSAFPAERGQDTSAVSDRACLIGLMGAQVSPRGTYYV